MQTYDLRAGVHYCIPDGSAIFLDVEADRYLGLPPSCQNAFAHLVNQGSALDGHVAELAPLTSGRLLVPTDDRVGFPPPVSVPETRQSALDMSDTRHTLGQFINAWRCQAQAKQSLARHRLSDVLGTVSKRKTDAGKLTVPPTDMVVAAFLATSIVTKNRDQCLRRSIAMINYLARYGCFPLFVIGVRTQPFEAHAWVQSGDTILNDEVEQVGRFTPILAI